MRNIPMRFRDIWKNGTLTTLRDTSIRLDDMKKKRESDRGMPDKSRCFVEK